MSSYPSPGRVERQRLIERSGIMKHVTHIRHLGRVERRAAD